MKKILNKAIVVFMSGFSVLNISLAYAANPVTKAWVLQQIALNPRALTGTDWNAVCTSGSATSSTGCYGNVSSAAFTKVSDHVGGFTTFANINPVNVPSSVFIKSFFGGTNIPGQSYSLNVNVSNSAARCGLFTEAGFGLGIPGIATNIPSSGNNGGGAPNSASVVSINNALSTGDIYYNNQAISSPISPDVGGPQAQYPIYLLCVGYNAIDGSTAAPVNIQAT